MEEKTLFEKMNVKYEEKDGILYPIFKGEQEGEKQDVGKYGHLWISYIKEQYPMRHRTLMRFGELQSKALSVNEIAYELMDELENEWLSTHKPKNRNSFTEMYELRMQARLMAEEMVLHDVVYMFH